jgi:hypothetical protein
MTHVKKVMQAPAKLNIFLLHLKHNLAAGIADVVQAVQVQLSRQFVAAMRQVEGAAGLSSETE